MDHQYLVLVPNFQDTLKNGKGSFKKCQYPKSASFQKKQMDHQNLWTSSAEECLEGMDQASTKASWITSGSQGSRVVSRQCTKRPSTSVCIFETTVFTVFFCVCWISHFPISSCFALFRLFCNFVLSCLHFPVKTCDCNTHPYIYVMQCNEM